jgi:hypothetical protein
MTVETIRAFPCITLHHIVNEGEDEYYIDGIRTTRDVWDMFKAEK